MTNIQAQEILILLKQAQQIGLRFDIGTAYIRRSYIEKQNELNKKIDDVVATINQQEKQP